VEYIIPRSAVEKGSLSFVIESSCNGMFGVPPGDIIEAPDVRSVLS
jgi:alpha-mannosidase